MSRAEGWGTEKQSSQLGQNVKMYPSTHAFLPSTHLDGSISGVGTVWKGTMGGELASNYSPPPLTRWGVAQTPALFESLSDLPLTIFSLYLYFNFTVSCFLILSTKPQQYALSLMVACKLVCAISVFYFPPLPSWCLHWCLHYS